MEAGRRRRWLWVVWSVCGLLASAGCWCAGEEASEAPDSGVGGAPGVAEPLREVTLSGPLATHYASAEALSPLDGRVAAAMDRLSSRSLRYDPCLARAAEAYGRYVKPRGAPNEARLPRELQEIVLHSMGCTDGWVSTHLFFTSSSGEEEFFQHLERSFSGIDTASTTHVGAARVPAAAPYRYVYVLFLAERHVELAPIPRAAAPHLPIPIRGRLAPGLSSPDVLILEPGGEVEPVDVVEEADGAFEATLRFESPGEQWVEILATSELGPRVLALFPIYVGQEPPRRFTLEPAPDESSVQGPEDAERLMFRLLNQDRARFGLPALRWNDAIAAIARRHSREMLDNNYFAHVSPWQGDLAQRFEKGSFPARTLGENISRNGSVYDAEAGLMLSLGHRENILSPSFTDVGVGVAMGVDAYGNRVMVFTQNFATPQRQLSGAQARDEILAQLQEGRQRRRMAPLRLDNDLQAVAARFARFGDSQDGGYPAAELTQRIKQALLDQGYAYRAFYVQTHTVLDPADIGLPTALTEAGVSRVGVGLFPDRGRSGAVRWKTLIILAEL